MADKRTLPALTAAMFAVSFSLVLFELLLTRLFAVVIFAQFAHLALALALLGISVGAVLQHVRPSLVPEQGLERRLGMLLLLQGITTLIAVVCTVEFPVTTQFETPPVTYQERSSIAANLIDPFWFGALLPILAVPFTIAGLAFAGTFQRRKVWIGRLYGADLLGGAVGAVAFLPLLTLLAGPDTVFVILAVTCGAAFALLRDGGDDNWTRAAGGLGAVALLASLVGLGGNEVLRVKYAAGYAEENVGYVHWTPLTRLAVHEDEKRGAYILLDNSSASQVVRSEAQRLGLTKEETRSLVYRLHDPPGHVAILAASAGPEVAVAQHFGFTDIEAIDIAGEIFDIVGDKFADDPTNPYTHGGTKRIKSDGRAAILHSKEPYDIIQMVHANLWSSAGLLSSAWSPSLLETTDAFHTYLDRLKPDGTLSFGRGQTTTWIVRASAEALRERGVKNPRQHIAYVKGRSSVMLLKPRPWTVAERDKLVEVLDVYRRGMPKWDPLKIDPLGEPDAQVRRWLNDGAVMTDDRPYFDTWDGVKHTLSQAFAQATGDGQGESPLAVVYRSIAIQALFVFAAGFLFILVPLFLRGASGVSKLTGVFPALLYICCLGYGYLALETVLIHELVLFVGHPTYAVTGVILSMLLFSGLGSVTAERVPEEALVRTLRGVLVAVLLLGLLQGYVVPGLLYEYFLGLAPLMRLAIVGLLLAPLGFVMGMPFPLAMRTLPEESTGIVPWAWALNGWMSVAASMMTVMISRLEGYHRAYAVSLAAYALAFVFAHAMSRVRPK
ncbi:MAG: hypothetical protein EP330_30870 [Deltaproteobacteria bacterium]|nr:MAG: hypothetical protein EP330_30870 [Deltaproteobacteria bacterium]